MKQVGNRIVFGALLAAVVASTGCSKSKAALKECQASDATSAAGLEVCYQAWKKYSDSSDFVSLTTEFDKRVTAACQDSARIKDCDKYCPLRITDPGPKYKTTTLSMCALKGYGTIDGQVTDKKPAVVTVNSPEVIEGCVSECKKKYPDTNDEYFACFRSCKLRKVQEMNAR